MRTGWAFVHHCLAHPLLFFSGEAPWAVWLHDRSGVLAWPSEST